MDVSEIVDQKSFEAWLEEQADSLVQDLARSSVLAMALRVVPFAIRRHCDEVSFAYLRVLTVFRCALMAYIKIREPSFHVHFDNYYGVVGKVPQAFDAVFGRQRADETVRKAGAFSVSTARAKVAGLVKSANEAVYANAEVTDAARYFGVGGQASIWPQLANDLSQSEGGKSFIERALWSVPLPDSVKACWPEVITFMQQSGGRFEFWIRWYEAILAGRPLTQDWDSH